MVDILLTAIIPVTVFIVLLCSVKLIKQTGGGTQNSSFMSLPYTNAIKAIACIIVVMVHIPATYGNTLQGLIGSFGYIGVTLFFLVSAYGCSYGVRNGGKRYLWLFWPKRIVSLFIPALIVNIVHLILQLTISKSFEPLLLININGYILATLVAYLIFWIVWVLKFIPEKVKDFIIIAFVLVGSLLTKLTPFSMFQLWPTEAIGFIWGILVFRYKDKIEQFILKHQLISIIVSLILSVGLGVVYLKVKFIFFAGDYLVKILLGVILIAFIFSISIRFSFNGKPIQFLGHISYEVYLLHGIVMTYLTILAGEIASGYYILATYALTVVFAIVIYLVSHFLIVQLNKLIISIEIKLSKRKEVTDNN